MSMCNVCGEERPDEWRVPDETTPRSAAVWRRQRVKDSWILCTFAFTQNNINRYSMVVLAKENKGSPPDDWRPK
jgi:hypothetical protein